MDKWHKILNPGSELVLAWLSQLFDFFQVFSILLLLVFTYVTLNISLHFILFFALLVGRLVPFKKLFIITLSVWIFCLHLSVYLLYAWYPQTLEEIIWNLNYRLLWAAIWCWDLNPVSLKEQPVLLACWAISPASVTSCLNFDHKLTSPDKLYVLSLLFCKY